MSTLMRKQVLATLDRYLAAELGRSFMLSEPGELSRQRGNFLSHFGPDQLAAMSGAELLRALPHNATTVPGLW